MRILAIVAHPDDEVLWAWPVMQNPQYERAVLCISDNSQKYSWRSKYALLDLAEQENWPAWCGDLPSGFSRLPFRDARDILPDKVAQIRLLIAKVILDFKPDMLFTHNPVGEYGHSDHRLIAELVYGCEFAGPVWVSDICIWNRCHVSYERMPKFIVEAFYRRPVGNIQLDGDFLGRCSTVYRKYSAWSWGDNPVAHACGMYEIPR